MSELTIELGITVGIPGKDRFNMAKPVLRWTIDSARDVDEQIAEHKAALEKVGPELEAALGQQLANVSGLSVSGAGQGAALAKLEGMVEFIIKEQLRVKKMLEGVPGALPAGTTPKNKRAKKGAADA